MTIERFKKASKTSATGESDTRETVDRMLREIGEGGVGMEGHARTGDVRLAKYYPNEEFLLDIGMH